MTTSTRLLDYKAKNGDSAAQVALSEIMAARTEGRQPDVWAAHIRAGTLPVRSPVAPAPAAVASAPARAATSSTPAITQWDVTMARESASQKATAQERARWAKVFASEHSQGRQKVCVTLLSAQKG